GGLGEAGDSAAPTLKSIVLEQFKTTHNVQDWFVPALPSVAGLTPEQANWKDGKGNHSIAQLVNHLTFWDKQQLAKFKGERPPAFSGNNEETFAGVADKAAWDAAVHQLDAVMTDWEKAIEAADDQSSSPGIPPSPTSARTTPITRARSSTFGSNRAPGTRRRE